MSKKGRKYGSRPSPKRHPQRRFIIAFEGAKTERGYFNIVDRLYSGVNVKPVPGYYGSAPLHVLRRMEDYLKKNKLKGSDEAWLVVDRDEWSPEQLDALHRWSLQKKNYGFALSNPKFEYWLLLHFEKGKGAGTSEKCSQQLKKYLPSYDKRIKPHEKEITEKRINAAINRAELRDRPPCKDWPRNSGVTTVYKLVKSIIQTYQAQSES